MRRLTFHVPLLPVLSLNLDTSRYTHTPNGEDVDKCCYHMPEFIQALPLDVDRTRHSHTTEAGSLYSTYVNIKHLPLY